MKQYIYQRKAPAIFSIIFFLLATIFIASRQKLFAQVWAGRQCAALRGFCRIPPCPAGYDNRGGQDCRPVEGRWYTCCVPIADVWPRPTRLTPKSTLTPSLKCVWCGNTCVDARQRPEICPLHVPPEGWECRPVNGECVVITPTPSSVPTLTSTPTTTPTPTSAPPASCPASCSEVNRHYNGPGRNAGDADCNGELTMNDFGIWLEQWQAYENQQTIPAAERIADFDCSPTNKTSQTVSLNDFAIWLEHFTP